MYFVSGLYAAGLPAKNFYHLVNILTFTWFIFRLLDDKADVCIRKKS